MTLNPSNNNNVIIHTGTTAGQLLSIDSIIKENCQPVTAVENPPEKLTII